VKNREVDKPRLILKGGWTSPEREPYCGYFFNKDEKDESGSPNWATIPLFCPEQKHEFMMKGDLEQFDLVPDLFNGGTNFPNAPAAGAERDSTRGDGRHPEKICSYIFPEILAGLGQNSRQCAAGNYFKPTKSVVSGPGFLHIISANQKPWFRTCDARLRIAPSFGVDQNSELF